MASQLFALRGKLPARKRILVEISGAVLLVCGWWAATHFFHMKSTILPSPLKTISAFPDLAHPGYGAPAERTLLDDIGYSLMLNGLGYVESIVIAVIGGFLIGLFSIPRALFERPITAMRYLPLTAVTGLMILWCGIGTFMKVQFLSLGILVYLLPVVVQRVDDVEQVYLDTAKTLGANRWQRIKTVFFPAVLSRLTDDIIVLIAISWTYIVIAEGVNLTDNGIGALVYKASRASRVDEVFLIIALILTIGWTQDKILRFCDRLLFPFKYT